MNLKHSGILVFTVLLLIGCKLDKKGPSINLPNIVWLVSEDNSKHYLQLYDKNGASMPNVEALAKNGIVFNNAFSNAPVCSVARSTIITGCYAPRVGAQYHRNMQFAPLPEGLKMFPEYLREAGYYTTNNAKEDYNFKTPEGVWDESGNEASYQKRDPGQPFFHVQNFHTTHEGQLHFSKVEMANSPTNSQNTREGLFPYHPDTPTFRYTNAFYRDLHQKVDVEIGNFIEQLKDDGLMEDTIIFYYGDHGGVLPRSKGYLYETGLNVPMVVYIPEKWKHLTSFDIGSSTDTFVEFVDLAPTVLHLAGIALPEQIDGKPFLGKDINLNKPNSEQAAFGYADRFDEKYDLVRSVRKGKFKYIRNYQPFNIDALYNFYRYKMLAYKEWEDLFKAAKLNKVQEQFFVARDPEALFDIEKDPYEIHNLATDSTYKKTIAELRAVLQNKVKAMPDLSFYPEPYFLENGLSNPVEFGQLNKNELSQLVDIADLSLLTFTQARDEIRKALLSGKTWSRYWGLIVCSTFGKQAAPFFDLARDLAAKDREALVRIRAVEFLALNNRPVPNALLLEILGSAKTEAEANLVLNSIALICTVNQGFELKIPAGIFPRDWVDQQGDLVNRRIDFINKKSRLNQME